VRSSGDVNYFSITSLTVAALPGQLPWDLPPDAGPPAVVVGGGGDGWYYWRRQRSLPAVRHRAPEAPPRAPALPVRHARADLIEAPDLGEGRARLLQPVQPEDEMLRLLALVLLAEETEDA
jgi:hypothetical protein